MGLGGGLDHDFRAVPRGGTHHDMGTCGGPQELLWDLVRTHQGNGLCDERKEQRGNPHDHLRQQAREDVWVLADKLRRHER